MKPKLLIKIIFFCLLTVLGILLFNFFKNTNKAKLSENISPNNDIIGGPCTYNQLDGLCKIISIAKTKESKDQINVSGGPGYEGFEINFKFNFDKKIDSNYSKYLNKEYLLKLDNSWYPGQKYLEKYKIKQGSSFNCQIKVITNGTCSPVIFDFKDINTNDYFETD
jgi:hypothetical protein